MIKTLYHKRILAVPHKTFRLPPVDADKIRVENTLFGWVLRLRRELIDCTSEAHARYLAAFARMGFTEVPVPKDARIIAEVLPDLERCVDQLWNQILEETSAELNPSRRREIIDLVWEGVRDRIEGKSVAS